MNDPSEFNTNSSDSRSDENQREPLQDALDQQPDGMASQLANYLLYTVSLPERTVRTTIGMAAGVAKEAANALVPQAFHDSKSYGLLVHNALRFLTEDIGGVEGESKRDNSAEEYLARKTVGNFVDLAGLATLHVSPMWFMAIVSDVAYGSKAYVLELAKELEAQGLIDDTSTIHHIDDVLEAVQDASGETASLFDTPPLSVDQLKDSVEKTRRAIGSADYSRVLPQSELTQYWDEMRAISEKENVSLLGVSGALTMHTLGKVSTVSHGAITSVQVVGGLFSRHVVGHYVESLKALSERGIYETLNDVSEPYVNAVWSNFARDKSTWTEEIVSGRAVTKAYDAVADWMGGGAKDSADAGEAPSEQAHSENDPN